VSLPDFAGPPSHPWIQRKRSDSPFVGVGIQPGRFAVGGELTTTECRKDHSPTPCLPWPKTQRGPGDAIAARRSAARTRR